MSDNSVPSSRTAAFLTYRDQTSDHECVVLGPMNCIWLMREHPAGSFGYRITHERKSRSRRHYGVVNMDHNSACAAMDRLVAAHCQLPAAPPVQSGHLLRIVPVDSSRDNSRWTGQLCVWSTSHDLKGVLLLADVQCPCGRHPRTLEPGRTNLIPATALDLLARVEV